MIITFDPNPSGVAPDYTGSYINFLRCVTAAATAAAGTTTLTVNPYTASGTIDATKNCILGIIYNTEGGGWTTSASHNVPSSGNNTATTYTPIHSGTNYQYKADFYNSSGKSAAPYNKMCFHSYADNANSDSYNTWSQSNATTTQRSQVGAGNSSYPNQGTNIVMTFGCSTTTDWTDTAFRPADTLAFNVSAQTKSFTMNGNTSTGTGLYNIPGLMYTNRDVYYQIAITENYCVIWERLKIATDGYTNGYFSSPTAPGITYWSQGRYGSVYYMGFRETQPWEDSFDNNPAWVCWSNTIERLSSGGTTTPYPHDQVAAYMLTLNNSGIINSTPARYSTQNRYNYNYMHGYKHASTTNAYQANQSYYPNEYSMIDVPLFQTRGMGSNGIDNQAGVNGQAGYEAPSSPNILYYPQYDPQTGTHVPGAYPIKISRSYGGTKTGISNPDTAAWNPGGACKGIYKSLSMPWPTMKLYWQSENQTFTINGETYMPFVILEDMWLVRAA